MMISFSLFLPSSPSLSLSFSSLLLLFSLLGARFLFLFKRDAIADSAVTY